ncbi:MAG TPA: winged helix DNA-binding domain-containing protein [Ktedonobacteraceae bacterium]|nr:winged helix DNA-binding domain-containing protein [Ktedonobacteraceae bacterium]
MSIFLSDHQLRYLRMRAQRLTPQQPDEGIGVAQVVKEVCGIQAQDEPAAALALRSRSVGLVVTDVEQARVNDRSIIRTWGPRGTLHLLASDDIGWLLPLLGPVFVASDRRRREELGLSEEICVRGMHIIRNVLADEGPLTRAELVERLATNGIHLEGQARPHLLARAALERLICFGPYRGAEPTYVLLNDWIDQKHTGLSLSEDEAYTELTRRYLSTYGPATPGDQASWSGLSLSKTRAAWQRIEGELLEVETASSSVWVLKSQAARFDELSPLTLIVRLLPRFDIYLLGYQKRDLAVPSQYVKRINAGGGIVHPTVLVDGRIVGTWKSKREKNRFVVMVEPFERLEPEIDEGLEAEIEDMARFLDVGVRMQVRTS